MGSYDEFVPAEASKSRATTHTVNDDLESPSGSH
jgi:hypothetical protein